MRTGVLVAVQFDGTVTPVPNTYEGIKAGLGGATLDLVQITDVVALYVDDNGMIENQPLNVPASMFAHMALYGPVVLCGGADDEGETLPPIEPARELLEALAAMWRLVVADAGRKGQVLWAYPDIDNLPPPQIIQLPDGWLPGDPLPEEDA